MPLSILFFVFSEFFLFYDQIHKFILDEDGLDDSFALHSLGNFFIRHGCGNDGSRMSMLYPESLN